MADRPADLARFFADLPDPRRERRRLHLLIDVVMIVVCAVIAGCDDWQDIELFARERREWFATFLELPNGVPSHDTMERLFARLDPDRFAACFGRWTAALVAGGKVGHVAIDGKSLRGSRRGGGQAIHLVGAWATEARLSLGQVVVPADGNEITAIPELLRLLDLGGALVTIDAIGCQKEIAAQIVAAGGDYLLSVKENQSALLGDIEWLAYRMMADDLEGTGHAAGCTFAAGHGRVARRTCHVFTGLDGLDVVGEWAGAKALGFVMADGGPGSGLFSVRWFVSSRVMRPDEYAEALREHWGTENDQHWQLDVAFGEDANRTADRNAAANLASARRIALALIRRSDSKLSVPKRRKKAMLNTAYLEEVLSGIVKMEEL